MNPKTCPPKVKILFLSHRFYPDIGGIEINSEILANYFEEFGADVLMMTKSKGSLEEKFSFQIIRSPSLWKLFCSHCWADIVFENNPALKLSWPLIFSRKKHIVAVRTWISRNDGKISLKDRIKLMWLNTADKIIAVSKEIKKSASSEAIVIGNPYRDELFRILPKEIKDRHFVFLGRLVSDKGADMAIDLLKVMNSDRTGMEKFTLSVVGDGPERSKLEEMVHMHSLTDCVHFTGFLEGETLVQCLNRHKYILIPSRWKEPFGNIALEGMACGCLPIVSNGGGLPEAVGNAGLAFERNCLQSLIQKVKGLLEDPELERQLRSNFSKHLESHKPLFVAGEYYKVIHKAISS